MFLNVLKISVPQEKIGGPLECVHHSLNRQTKQVSEFHADFVVDASRRTTNFPLWLEANGFQKPEKEEIEVDYLYMTRIFQLPENCLNFAPAIFKFKRLPDGTTNCGFMMLIENDTLGKRFQLSVSGQFNHKPLETEESFSEFVKSLDCPELYNIMSISKALTKPISYKYPSAQRYHYQRLTSLPARFVVVGDAFAATTPMFGAGMMFAVFEAVALNEVLSQTNEQNIDKIAPKYFKKATKFVDQVWKNIALSKLLQSEKKPSGISAIYIWYMSAVQRLSNHDPKVWLTLSSIASFTKPPISLFSPSIVFKVMLSSIKNFIKF